jgi:hypothetical protein
MRLPTGDLYGAFWFPKSRYVLFFTFSNTYLKLSGKNLRWFHPDQIRMTDFHEYIRDDLNRVVDTVRRHSRIVDNGYQNGVHRIPKTKIRTCLAFRAPRKPGPALLI